MVCTHHCSAKCEGDYSPSDTFIFELCVKLDFSWMDFAVNRRLNGINECSLTVKCEGQTKILHLQELRRNYFNYFNEQVQFLLVDEF